MHRGTEWGISHQEREWERLKRIGVTLDFCCSRGFCAPRNDEGTAGSRLSSEDKKELEESEF